MTSRTRSRVAVPAVYIPYTVQNNLAGTSSTDGPYLTAYDQEAIADVVASNYISVARKGGTVINPCKYQRDHRSSSGSGSSEYRSYSGSTLTGSYSGSGPLTLRVFSTSGLSWPALSYNEGAAKSAAMVNALANIDKTPLASGEDLLELRQTMQFIQSPLRGIVSEFKRRRLSSLVDIPAASWVTYRFAFMPLVRSIHDILSEVREPTKKPPSIRVAHGRSTFDGRRSDTILAPSGAFSFVCNRTQSVSGSYHAAIRYQVNNGTYNWRWRYGLRNKDFPASFWAAMPLSFMIDRLFDVSSMIGAVVNLSDPSVSILGASITRKSEYTTDDHVSGVQGSAPSQSYSASGESVKTTSFVYERNAWSPSIVDVVPPVNMGGLVSDATKIADLLAILRLRFR